MGSYPVNEILTLLLIIISRSKVLFFFSLISGIFVSISSSSWLIIWIGLEINLLSFIPLISSTSNQFSSEIRLKYFLIQALRSSCILVGLISSSYLPQSSNLIITLALIMKIGGAPFHFWFIEIIRQLNWLQIVILNTLQKVAPLILISYVIQDRLRLITITVTTFLSAFLGGVGGFNQRALNKIIAYSSLRHIAWILQRTLISLYLWLLYFTVYCLLLSSICFTFHVLKIKNIGQITIKAAERLIIKLIIAFPLISLAGLPPFSGFITKMMVISQLMDTRQVFMTIILISSSLLSLFFYFRIFLNSLVLSSSKRKIGLIRATTELSNKTTLILYFNFIVLLAPGLILVLS